MIWGKIWGKKRFTEKVPYKAKDNKITNIGQKKDVVPVDMIMNRRSRSMRRNTTVFFIETVAEFQLGRRSRKLSAEDD